MPDIPLSDTLGVTVNLKLADGSPLAQAGLSHVLSGAKSLGDEFAKPLDQVSLSSATLGFTLATPTALVGDTCSFAAKAGINTTFDLLKPKDHVLFQDDGFVPAVNIASNECWIGLKLEANTSPKAGVTANGFGLCVAEKAVVKCGIYRRFASAAGTFPTLRAALETALAGFRILHTAADIRNQPPGTVYVTEAMGTVKFTGSYTLPVSVGAFASADLPLHYQLSVSPAVTVKIAGEIALSGAFRVRCTRLEGDIVQLALYKERGTEFSVAFTAGAGVAVGSGGTDLITTILGAVAPGVSAAEAGLSGSLADPVRDVLKSSLDRSLAISVNTLCSAALSDETAVAYSIQMNAGDSAATDAALGAALAGDWTPLAGLPNASCLRNVATHTEEHKHKLSLNLLGFYNAASVTDFVKSSTVLRDENGRVFFVDKAKASRISTAATPYLADSERLKGLMAELNLASLTYAAGAPHLSVELDLQQQYLRYEKAMTRQEMRDEILLGAALGLINGQDWAGALGTNANFGHVRVCASATYNHLSAVSVFLANDGTPRSKQELAAVGRRTLFALIAPESPLGTVRRNVLANDQAWAAMDRTGNRNVFSTLPELAGLAPDEVAAVGSDWSGIRWWADAAARLAPQIAYVLAAADDQAIQSRRQALLTALQDVTSKSHAAFNEGWSLAVLSGLATHKPSLAMDITWAGRVSHYEMAAVPAVATALGG